MSILVVALAAFVFCTLLYLGRGFLAWSFGVVLCLAAWWLAGGGSSGIFAIAVGIALVLMGLFGVPLLRRLVVSKPLMRALAPALPVLT